MVADFSIINEFQEYITLKNIVIAHCNNIFRTQKNDGIVELDSLFDFPKKNVTIFNGGINDFFRNSNLKDFPDFRYLRIEKNTVNIVNN